VNVFPCSLCYSIVPLPFLFFPFPPSLFFFSQQPFSCSKEHTRQRKACPAAASAFFFFVVSLYWRSRVIPNKREESSLAFCSFFSFFSVAVIGPPNRPRSESESLTPSFYSFFFPPFFSFSGVMRKLSRRALFDS